MMMMRWTLREAVPRQTCPEGKFILSAEPFLVQVRQDPGRALDVSVSTEALKVQQRPRRAALRREPKLLPRVREEVGPVCSSSLRHRNV